MQASTIKWTKVQIWLVQRYGFKVQSSQLSTINKHGWGSLDQLISTNVLVFGDLNVHYKDWLTYSGGTDSPGELCSNFCISNDLTQIVNFPTRIPDCDSHSPALLDLFLSSDTCICSTMAFSPWQILTMLLSQFPLTFPQTQNRMSHFIELFPGMLVFYSMLSR